MDAAEITKAVKELDPRRRALLQDLLKSLSPAGPIPVRHLRSGATRPLSFAQQRMWFLSRMHRWDSSYNLATGLVIRGSLASLALQQSLDQIIRRHEVLHSIFVEENGNVSQRLTSPSPATFRILDLQNLSAETRCEAARWAVAQENARPFDLTKGPLLRATLIRISPDLHYFVFVTHHIVADGWSTQILLSEISSLYECITRGACSALSEPLLQYADFTEWQKQRLKGSALDKLVSFWQARLTGCSPSEFPPDHPRPAVSGRRGSSKSLQVSGPLTEELNRLCRQEGITLHVALLSLFQLLLNRHTGLQQTTIGTVVTGRFRQELESIVGFFANSLPISSDLGGNPSFRNLLIRVRDDLTNALEHQELPLEKIVQEMHPSRDWRRNPLFHSVFVLQSRPWTGPTASLPGLDAEPLELEATGVAFDLVLIAEKRDICLNLTIRYDADLFRPETIKRLLSRFRQLLEAAVAVPTSGIEDLPLEPDADELLSFEKENDTFAPYATDACLHELVLERARQTPDRVAVTAQGCCLTYGALAYRMRCLAGHLQSLGVTVESRVGLVYDHSVDSIVGLLGTLQAGAAYVPLDPSDPPERCSHIIRDAGVQLVLSCGKRADWFPQCPVAVVPVKQDSGQLAQAGNNFKPAPTSLDNAAYVIYTSGSTGLPKGVCCVHRSIVNLLGDYERRRQIPEQANCSLWSRLSFDVSLFEIFSALLAGRTLHISPEELRANGNAYLDWLAQNQIQSAFIPGFVLSDFHEWLQKPNRRMPLLRMLVGVEPIPESLLVAIREQIGDITIVNGYGPTETSVCITFYVLGDNDRSEGSVPIGKVLQNNRLYLLDHNLDMVPVGIPGEICVSGDALAQGYVNQPELTAAAFVPDAHGRPGTRMYRTGDFARRRADGNLCFMGRRDRQVKIRGARVELGEVEAAMSLHPAVRQAVVVDRQIAPNGKQLVCYFVPRHQPPPTARELMAFLANRLPAPMIPSHFLVQERLPVTANGKIDFRALPEPEQSRTTTRLTSATFRTPTEEIIATIWAEVLGVETVGREDNFFELGGHSLLVATILAGIRESVGVELPMSSIFEAPTVAALAEMIDCMRPLAAPSQSPLIKPSVDDSAPLSFAQARLWFLYQLDPANPSYNIPFAFRLRGNLNTVLLETALTEILRRHDILRTTFSQKSSTPLQTVSVLQPLKITYVDLMHLSPASRDSAARWISLAEAARPFNLERGPMFQAKLLRLSATEFLLLLTTHHIVFDGSHELFFQELAELCREFSDGRFSSHQELRVRYSDFARWQRESLQGPVLESQLAFWKERLSGPLPALELRLDPPFPSPQAGSGKSAAFTLPPPLDKAIHEFARREGLTVNMVLLAAFFVLLYRYTGQPDIIIGIPILNRGPKELKGLIGCFVNTIVLRMNVSGELSFQGICHRVRERLLEAYAHQDLPLEMLVRELHPQRDWGRQPLFQVMFSNVQSRSADAALDGLEVVPVHLDTSSARFDLLWGMAQTPNGTFGAVEYNTHRFHATTIQRMQAHFNNLLEAAAADPRREISAMPLLGPEEQHEQLVTWNNTDLLLPANLNLRRLLDRPLIERPDAVALVCDGQHLTYRELHRWADQLADHLHRTGADPGSLVGIFMGRSPEIIAAMLGVIKAGCAYVPLDVDAPAARIRGQLESFGDTHLVTDTPHREAIAQLAQGAIKDIMMMPAPASEKSRDPAYTASTAQPEQLAYVIFTSGSTGIPKGVMVQRGPLLNLIDFMNREFRVDCMARMLWVTSPCFDLSVYDIFGLLAAGGTIFIATREDLANPLRIIHLLENEQITIWDSTPAGFQQLMPSLESRTDRPVRIGLQTVLLSGDWIPVTLPSQIVAAFPAAQVISLGGATEATIWSNYFRIQQQDPGWVSIPYGRPIQNARYYILDERLQPAPMGVPGDLYIGGPCLALGYHSDPLLTAAKFIPDPHGPQPGARLYHTGDRARHWSDGTIEFLGRVDDQVKVRGFRIELGEIESSLAQHPDVQACAVAAHRDANGDNFLVAYVVRKPNKTPDIQTIRRHLRARLPQYMLPGVVIFLEALPLTATGKINRRGLPAPSTERGRLADKTERPLNPTEQVLVRLWSQVLGIPTVGIHEDFFELGGHSLLAIELLSKIRQELRVELSLKTILEAPSIAELSEQIVGAKWAAQSAISQPGATAPGGDREEGIL